MFSGPDWRKPRLPPARSVQVSAQSLYQRRYARAQNTPCDTLTPSSVLTGETDHEMTRKTAGFGPSLRHVKGAEWFDALKQRIGETGYLARLGPQRFAAFAQAGPTLLVTFETLQGIQSLSPVAQPMGWEMVKEHGWSSLTLISKGDTWFRDPAVFAYFDRLVDDGFFDTFESVVFYGAGSCGYAAAAYSVAAPGAYVLVIQPQATLAPDLTEWDRRFPEQRRVNFTDRYGYAPDMLEAAHTAFIVYDPQQTEDAMHASLFTGQNVTKLRMAHMGSALQTDVLQMGVLFKLLAAAGRGALTPQYFARVARARRAHMPYLRKLLAVLERDEQDGRVRLLCENVCARMHAPRFERHLKNNHNTSKENA